MKPFWRREYKQFEVTRCRPYAFGVTRRGNNRGYIYNVGVRKFASWKEAKTWIDQFWIEKEENAIKSTPNLMNTEFYKPIQ